MINNKPYDWEKTLKPEKPYNFEYDKSVVYTLNITEKDRSINANEALEYIKAIDKITLGVKKIVYLNGWQHDGKNSVYPSFFEVFDAFKNNQGQTAKESLLWLIKEAENYNTDVSLKINLTHADKNSPLFETYFNKDLLFTDLNGNLLKIKNSNGEWVNLVNIHKEWECGYLERRINKLLELFPLKTIGTLFIEGLNVREDKASNIPIKTMKETRLKIIRFLRSLKIDVVTDYLYYEKNEDGIKEDSLVGLVPYVFNLSQNLIDYMKRPAKLICGGKTTNLYKENESLNMNRLFGESMDLSGVFSSKNYKEKVLKEFCTKFVKFRFLNSLDRISASITPEDICCSFSKNVNTFYNEDKLTINGVIAKKENELLLPTDWYDKNTAVLYTEKGGRIDWNVSKILGFASSQNISLAEITKEGVSEKKRFTSLKGGMLELDLEQGAEAAFLISRL